MPTNERFDDIPSEEPIIIQPSGTAYAGAADLMPGGGNDAAQEGIGGLALLHAVRRHLLVILSTGLACAAVTGTTLWLVQKPLYKATALLQLAPAIPSILGKATADQSQQVQNEFDIFRDTQQSLIKSRFVITAALRDPKLKNRACILREDATHNTIQWLTDEIRVDFPAKNAGIMQISATEPDREDAAAITNAVVDAYMNEVVNYDRQQRRDRLSDLQGISAEKENEVRTKREQLKRELETIGAGDDETMKARGAMAVSIYAQFLAEYQRMRAENRSLLARLQEAKRSLQDLTADMTGAQIPEAEVVMLLNSNPMYRDLQSRLTILTQMTMQHTQAVTPTTKAAPGFVRTKADYENTKLQLEDLEQKSRDQIHGAKRVALEQDIRRLENQVAISTEQMTGFEKEVEHKGNEADSVGRSSVAAQMARAEVDNVERILHGVAEERERLRVELKSQSRVKILGDPNAPAAVPENETNDRVRYLLIIAGSLLAMFAPGVGIVMWDLRKELVNTVSDVSKRLKIPVLGTVPLIPATIMRRLGDTTLRSQIWKIRFTESVDGVVARLLRKGEEGQTVILVTSAMGGEGKTTLATQLAMSLARAKRNTVLVDFDLRRPTLHEALGLPLGPGICEALRGQGDIADMAEQTETDCLSVVTAGSWNRRVLAHLSNRAVVGAMLEKLRAKFDFVIIDSSPLLPTVDARLVSQDVDAVVLSVFRDVSQGSKVLAAKEMLDCFGAPSVEAVVTGGEEHANAKHPAFQAMVIDAQDDQVEPAENEVVG